MSSLKGVVQQFIFFIIQKGQNSLKNIKILTCLPHFAADLYLLVPGLDTLTSGHSQPFSMCVNSRKWRALATGWSGEVSTAC